MGPEPCQVIVHEAGCRGAGLGYRPVSPCRPLTSMLRLDYLTQDLAPSGAGHGLSQVEKRTGASAVTGSRGLSVRRSAARARMVSGGEMLSATSWLNILVVIIGVSVVLTYEWVHKTLHWVHWALAGAVAYAAGLTAARQKYDREMQLYSAYVRCQNLVSALQTSCHKRNLPIPSYYPQQPSLGDVVLDGLKGLPFLFLGVAIGIGIVLAWNTLNPKHQIEDHFSE